MASTRVLHAIRRYGLISEGFVADAISETDALGCETWLATNSVEHRDVFPFPADAAITRWERPVPGAWEDVVPRLAAARFRGRLAPLLERVEPALVHAHFGWSARDFAGACAATGTPLLATFHGSDATVYPTFRRRERLSPANASRDHRLTELLATMPRAIAVSSFIAERVRELGYRGPIDIIPAGVRLEAFPYRAPREAPDDPRLIFIGRLVDRKGLDVLLAALARLPHDRATLAVVGDGPRRAALEQLATELRLDGRVRFHGALPRPRVIELLAGSDVLVMSSRTMPSGEAEGSPVVTKEALAIGLPFVATDSGGTRETFPPELAHEVVPEDDADALAGRLEAVVGDPGDWARRSTLGRRFAEERFSWRALAERTTAVYEEMT
jgi:colanic acid/amylovoran biosynthesis glycosyltransferase